jgi:hypothetical protein
MSVLHHESLRSANLDHQPATARADPYGAKRWNFKIALREMDNPAVSTRFDVFAGEVVVHAND